MNNIILCFLSCDAATKMNNIVISVFFRVIVAWTFEEIRSLKNFNLQFCFLMLSHILPYSDLNQLGHF